MTSTDPAAGPPNRRRFLTITAAAAGAALVPRAPGAAGPDLHVWTGTALGARAGLRLLHPDRAEAERLIAACVSEIGRLERIFSLHRPGSDLRRLNAAGALKAPPFDLVRLMEESRGVSALTGGAFDVTVQPLWELHAAHFRRSDADPAGPPRAALEAAAARVDWRRVFVAPSGIAFGAPGMAATLNGIAQGFVTDRIAEMLRRAGLSNVLIDLGEIRGLGAGRDGRPWRAAVADPAGAGIAAALDLRDRALATTAPSGFAFDPAKRVHHLFDPRSGRSRSRWASISVTAPRATEADALSTAFAQMRAPEIAAALDRRPGVGALLIGPDGRRMTLGPFGT
jgi:thiamine biosynthesis lipoprotein